MPWLVQQYGHVLVEMLRCFRRGHTGSRENSSGVCVGKKTAAVLVTDFTAVITLDSSPPEMLLPDRS